jgi:hypothetical protein
METKVESPRLRLLVHFRNQALKCQEEARRTVTHVIQREFLDRARKWEQLAERFER